jgi:uncharacterized iron-regulated membrane protein
MRVDGKAEGPRQSMSWLHTWASLILGWLLYAIFVTGTLSFFQNEISVWMKPELHQSVPSQSQIQQTQVALNYLQKNHPDAGSWSIQLPTSRQNTTVLNIRGADEDPRARRGGKRITLDSATGEVLEARETRGGSFLYRFHFELYGLERSWARWIVGIATMLMFVAIISGIITHKKIFKDFFTFRPGKGQRSWLDAHNATAVFALPFHLMITFSGLLLLLFTLMPWGIERIYDNRGAFLQEQRKALIETPEQERAQRGEQNPGQQARGENRNERAEGQPPRGEGRGRGRQKPAAIPAPLTDLAPILANAQQQWPNNSVGTITIVAPNTSKADIELRALHGESVAHRNIYQTLSYNGVTGLENPDDGSKLKNPTIPAAIYNVTTTLHEARGVDLPLRWLLFCSGILGTLMVATGLLLWCVKRAPQQQKQGYKSFGYRTVEVLNITAIIGLPIACAGYFYANRLIDAGLEKRSDLEIRAFFITWALVFVYALVRQHRQAWLEMLTLATALFALLPVLNVMTGGAPLWSSITNGQWVIASFDLAMWVLALVFGFSLIKVKKHQGLPAKKAKAQPENDE